MVSGSALMELPYLGFYFFPEVSINKPSFIRDVELALREDAGIPEIRTIPR